MRRSGCGPSTSSRGSVPAVTGQGTVRRRRWLRESERHWEDRDCPASTGLCCIYLCVDRGRERAARVPLSGGSRFSDWRGNQALSNGILAGQLARAPRWLLIEPCSSLNTSSPLHLLLEDKKRLLNAVVTSENLHCTALPCWSDGETPERPNPFLPSTSRRRKLILNTRLGRPNSELDRQSRAHLPITCNMSSKGPSATPTVFLFRSVTCICSLSCQSFGPQPFQIFAHRDLLLLVFGRWAVRWTEYVVDVIFGFAHDSDLSHSLRESGPGLGGRLSEKIT